MTKYKTPKKPLKRVRLKLPVPKGLRGATLAEAKRWVEKNLRPGASCPCCGQFAKVYKRTITSSMAYMLILIDRHFRTTGDKGWLHVPEYLSELKLGGGGKGTGVRGGDWAKLVHFGLLRAKRGTRRSDGSSRVGLYRMTPLGERFVRGKRTRAPKHVFLYDSKCFALPSTERVTLKEALGERFNYAELMAR